jgi:hypothetical protein
VDLRHRHRDAAGDAREREEPLERARREVDAAGGSAAAVSARIDGLVRDGAGAGAGRPGSTTRTTTVAAITT